MSKSIIKIGIGGGKPAGWSRGGNGSAGASGGPGGAGGGAGYITVQMVGGGGGGSGSVDYPKMRTLVPTNFNGGYCFMSGHPDMISGAKPDYNYRIDFQRNTPEEKWPEWLTR